MCHAGAEHDPGEIDAGHAPDELREDVEGGVPARHLPEAPEGERDGRIEMRARSAAPRRVDDRDRGRCHRDAHEEPSRQVAPETASRRGGRAQRRSGQRGSGQRRSGMIQQGHEHTGRDHEEPQMGRFHQVFGPVAPEGLAQGAVHTSQTRRPTGEVRSIVIESHLRPGSGPGAAHGGAPSGPAAAWSSRGRGRPGRSSARPGPAGPPGCPGGR